MLCAGDPDDVGAGFVRSARGGFHHTDIPPVMMV